MKKAKKGVAKKKRNPMAQDLTRINKRVIDGRLDKLEADVAELKLRKIL